MPDSVVLVLTPAEARALKDHALLLTPKGALAKRAVDKLLLSVEKLDAEATKPKAKPFGGARGGRKKLAKAEPFAGVASVLREGIAKGLGR